jgi:nitrogen-specific signal transduction histidine kinase
MSNGKFSYKDTFERSELIKTKNNLELVKKDHLESEKFVTIEKLAATLMHEIKNPLTSLQNIMFFFFAN